MLWYKSWLETRWRFLIGLLLLMFSACGTVVSYPQVLKLLSVTPAPTDLSGSLGQRVAETIEFAREYRSYVWSHWFSQNMLQLWAVFAVLLGTGGLLSQSSGGGTLFTLSLPVTRRQLLGVRAATGLLELLVLAFVPSLLISLLSPMIGQAYGLRDVLIHGTCMFIAGSVFFTLAFLLSTVFTDIWRPMLLVLCLAFVAGLADLFIPELEAYNVLNVMTAESYFRNGSLPWLGLLATTALSVMLLFAANKNIARQDF